MDEEGYLLQILQTSDRPTLFFEIIQRMGKVWRRNLKPYLNPSRAGIARNAIKTRFTLCEK
jgi:hypothetical protein